MNTTDEITILEVKTKIEDLEKDLNSLPVGNPERLIIRNSILEYQRTITALIQQHTSGTFISSYFYYFIFILFL